MKNNISGFTLVELIVVSAIIIILGTIGFASFSSNLPDARDAERKGSLAKIKAAAILYKQERGNYPIPGDNFTLTRTGVTVAYQGWLNEKVTLKSLDTVPVDPKIKKPYIYSVTSNRQEFQIAGTLENDDTPRALLIGDYKSVSKNVLPTITVASTLPVEITTTQDLFIFDNGAHNLPYDFNSPYNPYTDGTSFTGIINDPFINYWQNSDYRSCTEIIAAAKAIGDGEYQIVNTSGVMTNTGCTGM